MAGYHPAGQDIYFFHPIPELEPFGRTTGAADKAVPVVPNSFHKNELVSRTSGWVSGAQRIVEVYATLHGLLLKVEGCGEFFIASNGELISKLDYQYETGFSTQVSSLQKLDREIILGPALVLTLALRNVWCLHASAVIYKENVIVFLGESGQGKSTLAGYLSQSAGWRLVADDILPVQIDPNGVYVLPHFPQLKLPMNAQPGVGFPEHLPLHKICVLANAAVDQMPELQKLSTAQAAQFLLSHIAGTRMFPPMLLTRHLEFSVQAAKYIPTYRLIHPHRRDTLPLVREFLEKIC